MRKLALFLSPIFVLAACGGEATPPPVTTPPPDMPTTTPPPPPPPPTTTASAEPTPPPPPPKPEPVLVLADVKLIATGSKKATLVIKKDGKVEDGDGKAIFTVAPEGALTSEANAWLVSADGEIKDKDGKAVGIKVDKDGVAELTIAGDGKPFKTPVKVEWDKDGVLKITGTADKSLQALTGKLKAEGVTPEAKRAAMIAAVFMLRPDGAKKAPAKAEPKKDEPKKAEPKKDEPKKAEPKKP